MYIYLHLNSRSKTQYIQPGPSNHGEGIESDPRERARFYARPRPFSSLPLSSLYTLPRAEKSLGIISDVYGGSGPSDRVASLFFVPRARAHWEGTFRQTRRRSLAFVSGFIAPEFFFPLCFFFLFSLSFIGRQCSTLRGSRGDGFYAEEAFIYFLLRCGIWWFNFELRSIFGAVMVLCVDVELFFLLLEKFRKYRRDVCIRK